MKCGFKNLQELMEYVEEEAQRRVRKILREEESDEFEFKLSAPGEYMNSI